MKKVDEILKFPDGFLWGSATAAHQIEGNNFYSDWWVWEQQNKVKDKSGKACDGWRLWKEDIDLAKSLHQNSYRFSLEWAKIEPEEGKFNLEALKHYQEEIKYLHKNGMKAVLTLWHFSSPSWFSQKGGFCKGENIKYITRYVQFILDNLNDYPDFWITFNEPNSFLYWAYTRNMWPPGFVGPVNFVFAYFNFLDAHKKIYDQIHKKIPKAMVSICPQVAFMKTLSTNWALRFWGKVSDLISNWTFYLPLNKKMDYLCLNYYVLHICNFHNFFPKIRSAEQVIKMLQVGSLELGYPVFPQGLYQTLLELKKYKLPILITENGVNDPTDKTRSQYISKHLEFVHLAIKEGAPVIGYLHWTLYDNFEWALGYNIKFGLCETDFKTFERVPRPSAKFYSQICKTNELDLRHDH